MDRRAAWVLGIVFGGFFLCVLGFMALMYFAFQGDGVRHLGGDRVGVLEILGPIEDSKKLLKQLKHLEEDGEVKAIVVRIDSPGGAVAPSQELYEAIHALKAKKHVVASMGSVAASGGYYIASAAEKIFANPGTLTGSIGVIFQIPNVTGLLKWAGVSMNTITAGKLKDSGSPFKEMTPEERAYFQTVLADVHEQFIGAVAEGRGLPIEKVRPYADGRVFTGRQAKEYQLVDELGGIKDAALSAAEMAGLKGEPQLQYPPEEKHFLRELLGEETRTWVRELTSEAANQVGVGLQYRLQIP